MNRYIVRIQREASSSRREVIAHTPIRAAWSAYCQDQRVETFNTFPAAGVFEQVLAAEVPTYWVPAAQILIEVFAL